MNILYLFTQKIFHSFVPHKLNLSSTLGTLQSTLHGYPIEVKREALRYYLEGIGFRRIERLLGVSHTAVIYWVKKAGEKIKNIVFEGRKTEKVDVLEFDEMCVNLKKIEQKMDMVGSREIFSENKRILCGLS